MDARTILLGGVLAAKLASLAARAIRRGVRRLAGPRYRRVTRTCRRGEMPLHEVLTCRGPPKNPIQIPSARLRSKLHSILPFSLATPAHRGRDAGCVPAPMERGQNPGPLSITGQSSTKALTINRCRRPFRRQRPACRAAPPSGRRGPMAAALLFSRSASCDPESTFDSMVRTDELDASILFRLNSSLSYKIDRAYHLR
jgi:hypothetical protein